jgi:hypothetical protein
MIHRSCDGMMSEPKPHCEAAQTSAENQLSQYDAYFLEFRKGGHGSSWPRSGSTNSDVLVTAVANGSGSAQHWGQEGVNYETVGALEGLRRRREAANQSLWQSEQSRCTAGSSCAPGGRPVDEQSFPAAWPYTQEPLRTATAGRPQSVRDLSSISLPPATPRVQSTLGSDRAPPCSSRDKLDSAAVGSHSGVVSSHRSTKNSERNIQQEIFSDVYAKEQQAPAAALKLSSETRTPIASQPCMEMRPSTAALTHGAQISLEQHSLAPSLPSTPSVLSASKVGQYRSLNENNLRTAESLSSTRSLPLTRDAQQLIGQCSSNTGIQLSCKDACLPTGECKAEQEFQVPLFESDQCDPKPELLAALDIPPLSAPRSERRAYFLDGFSPRRFQGFQKRLRPFKPPMSSSRQECEPPQVMVLETPPPSSIGRRPAVHGVSRQATSGCPSVHPATASATWPLDGGPKWKRQLPRQPRLPKNIPVRGIFVGGKSLFESSF